MCLAVLFVLAWLVPPEQPWARALMAAAVMALMFRYLGWRILETWTIDESLNAEAVWHVVFAFVETLGLLGVGLSWLFHSRCIDRSQEATLLATRIITPPLIDVFIPTYNESRAILERTITSAMAMDYPLYRVWVLDDGDRAEVHVLAQAMGVGYLARSARTHAKAGNMNAGLAHVLGLETPPEFIAILDADFAPGRMFLTRAVALFQHSDVGLVQTPQHFFNPDPLQTNLELGQLVPDDQRFTQGVDLPSRDAWGVATSCGTSSIVRVSSLRAIGGFPTESICEDTLTSIKFWALGQKTVFLNEPLSQGLAVEGVRELLTQRSRWATGNMQILLSPWGLFSHHRMPFMGRLFLVSLLCGAIISPLNRIIIVASPAVFLLTGVLPIPADFVVLGSYLGPFLIAHYIGTAWVSRGANIPMINDALLSLEYCSTFPASLRTLLRPRARRFEVTVKGVSRVASIIHWKLILIFLAPVLIYVLGVTYEAFYGNVAFYNPAAFICVLVWCLYNSIFLILAAYLAIDLPRSAELDEFQLDETASLQVEGQSIPCRIATMSTKVIVLTPPDELVWEGAAELVLHDGAALRGRMVAAPGSARLCAFKIDAASRPLAARHLFSGRFVNSVQKIRFWRAFLRLGRRVFT